LQRLPAEPLSDWKPQDPVVLQSARERYESVLALDRNASALVAQGKCADALTLLAPAETGMRKHWSNSWLLARFLPALAWICIPHGIPPSPAKGFEAKADEWRQMLAKFEANKNDWMRIDCARSARSARALRPPPER